MSPWASTAAATKPINISEKYSGEPNFRAISAIGGPNSAISSVHTQPAKNELIAAIASVLVKMGEQFENQARSTQMTASMLHPAVLTRLIAARLRALRERRPVLPRDLWPCKAIITAGMDTAIYKDAIQKYWGAEPYEFYSCAETMMLAIQGWNKKGMYFLPDIAFFEFIPEAESTKLQEDPSYQPRTVLLDEVEAGHLYEGVITHLYGMPFLRYRMKDLVRFTSLQD